MLAVNYSTVRNNLKKFCDEASDRDETIVITRKNEKNIVMLSLFQYNQLLKEARNARYLAMIDRSIDQLNNGMGTEHELIEVDDEETLV